MKNAAGSDYDAEDTSAPTFRGDNQISAHELSATIL
jgi:hypothetical protein